MNDATTTQRRPDEPLEANKGPGPRPADYKRDPFATHSGKTERAGWHSGDTPSLALILLLSLNPTRGLQHSEEFTRKLDDKARTNWIE